MSSILSGHIVFSTFIAAERALAHIHEFSFDPGTPGYPFGNCFIDRLQRGRLSLLLCFASESEGIELAWPEWLWKFATLLSGCDATGATVVLDSPLGVHAWKLEPRPYVEWHSGARRKCPETFAGSEWVIVSAPQDDFTTDQDWLDSVAASRGKVRNPITGKYEQYKWDKVLLRMGRAAGV